MEVTVGNRKVEPGGQPWGKLKAAGNKPSTVGTQTGSEAAGTRPDRQEPMREEARYRGRRGVLRNAA